MALARSLAKNPKLLLLDEPLGALDAKLREQTQFELMNIQEKTGTTFIIVTHDQEEAMTVASRIGLMNKGLLAQVATPGQIYENPATRFVADFIGDVNLIEGSAGKQVRHGRENFIVFHANGGRNAAGQLLARCNEPLAAGGTCWMSIRPEKIMISKSRPPVRESPNLLHGKVHDIGYVGNLTTYHVQLQNGAIIKAQEANRARIANREFTWEDEVWLAWSPSAAVLLNG